MTRLTVAILFAVSAHAQYAASDDGSIVYFSRPALTVNGTDYGWRLFAWSGGFPHSVIDAPPGEFVRLIKLAADGQRLLVWRSTGFQVWRRGATAPLLTLPLGAVAMSRNGRWLAAVEPHAATRWELTDSGARPAGTLSGTLLQPPPHSESFVGDDGTVNLQCDGGKSCAWDGRQTVSLPAFFPPGGVGPFLYHWNNPTAQDRRDQELEQFDWRNQKSVAMQARCPKRVQNYYSPSGILQMTSYSSQASLGATDPDGRRVVIGCVDRPAVLDSVSGIERPLPPEAVLDTTLTRVLSRPTPDRFAWVPVDAAVPSIGRFDNVAVTGPVTAYGLLTAISDPDYTLTWGGQSIPWLRGSGGYSYAPLPSDLVSGAIDAVVVQSTTRPWWNTTVSVPGEPISPTAVPMFYGDPWVLLQHGDYRGFLTPTSPARRGDYLHFLISGVAPGTTPDAATTATYSVGAQPVPGRQFQNFPIVALSPTPYHPAIRQLTIRIPDDASALPPGGVLARFSFTLRTLNPIAFVLFNPTAFLNY